jgi:Protein of unknown function (DUF1091)
LRLKHWLKASGNKYIPGLYDVEIDICDVAGNMYSKNDNFARFFFDTTVPEWRKKYGDLFHPCPYQNNLIFNQTLKGVPCKWISGTRLFTGKARKASETKTEIMIFNKDDAKKKPTLLVTLFDSKN